MNMQKIMLLKDLKEVVYDNKENSTTKKNGDGKDIVDSERRNELLNMVAQEIEKRKIQ